MNRFLYRAPAIDYIDLGVAQVIAASFEDGGEGLKWNNNRDDADFFWED